MDIYNKPPLDVYLRHYSKPSLDECLAHHGIRGQKWGVRNGPPYPLGDSNHSASEKKAGWRKSLDKGGVNESDKKPINLHPKTVGSIIRNTNQAKMAASNNITNNDISLKKKTNQYTAAEDLALVNPNFDSSAYEANEWNTNCSHCVATYEMRRRGYDVTATPMSKSESSKSVSEFVSLFPGMKFSHVTSASSTIQKILFGGVFVSNPEKDYKDLCSNLERFGDGARGFVIGTTRFGGGHIFSWEIKDGKATFIDPQSNTMDDSETVKSGFYISQSIGYARVDNLDIDKKQMGEYMTNRR